MKPRRLFTPGPTTVPDEVLETMAQPLGHHRTPEFRKIHLQAVERLKYIYQTTNPVLILTASGSGAMESAVVNITRPGEKALVLVAGKFSERWRDLGEAYGLDLVVIDGTWGEPISPDEVRAAFAANPDIRTVFTTHCETSTGTVQDVEAYAEIAHQNGALIAVDGITSLGAQFVNTDRWKLDMVIGGSQKGFMIPPGLSFISVSQSARDRMERGRHPVFYFDLLKALTALEKGDTPWTPAMTLIIALNEALRMMQEEGLEAVVKRHDLNAAAVRAAVTALEIPLFSKAPANATTAIVPPDGSANDIKKRLDEHYGIKVAGGQGQIKGKVLRLGHLGYYYDTDMFQMISALEATLSDLGINKAPGKGIDALLTYYREHGA